MTRQTDSLLQPGQSYGVGKNAQMSNLQYGGMNGWAPPFGEWVNNAAYIRKNLIAILLEAPKFFDLYADAKLRRQALRALVELHPVSIEGLSSTLTVEAGSETPVGGGGQMQQDWTNVTESRSEPVFRYIEKYGRAIHNFYRSWIIDGIADPNTKAPAMVTLATKPTDLLPDMYSMSVLFIEPDPTYTKVQDSWLGTNMYPLTSGEKTARMDKTAGGEQVSMDINFTGIFQHNPGVDAFAQKIFTAISLTGANPQMRESFIKEIDAQVQAEKASFSDNVASTAAQAIRL